MILGKELWVKLAEINDHAVELINQIEIYSAMHNLLHKKKKKKKIVKLRETLSNKITMLQHKAFDVKYVQIGPFIKKSKQFEFFLFRSRRVVQPSPLPHPPKLYHMEWIVVHSE